MKRELFPVQASETRRWLIDIPARATFIFDLNRSPNNKHVRMYTYRTYGMTATADLIRHTTRRIDLDDLADDSWDRPDLLPNFA